MDEVIDEPVRLDSAKPNVTYGGFWVRFGALFVDGLVLLPFSLGLTYYNIVNWKSTLVLVVITLLGIAYKPFMEFAYGATLGKMAFKLRVKSLALEQASLTEILLRNVFHIIPTLISLWFSITIYNDPDFEFITGFFEFTTFSRQFDESRYVNFGDGLIVIVDAVFLLASIQKRALHDLIGGTVVIQE